MASDNTVTLVGNITDDPELRFTPSGAAVANFTVAVNRRFKNSDQWEDKLDGFFRCNCWRDMAENVAESLHKGTRVVVVGRLQQRIVGGRRGQQALGRRGPGGRGRSLARWATAQIQKSQSSSGGGSAPAAVRRRWRATGATLPPVAVVAAVALRGEGGGGADWSSPAPVGGQQPPEGGF